MNKLFAHAAMLALLSAPLHAAEIDRAGAPPRAEQPAAGLAQPNPAPTAGGSGSDEQRVQRAADAGAMRGNANRFVVGSLIDTRRVPIDGGDGYHRLLKLESENGRQIIVDIGAAPPPSAFGFRQGDLLVAMGKSARINGHPVLYAYYVGGLYELSEDDEDVRMDAPDASR